jgi:formylmethanofuran dehydrogenase subunit E
MTAQDILNSEDFKQCEQFHGHICPGLSIGYRAAKTAMEWLSENRSEDEEVVAIVETDACSADAVQVLTGCTFGKGNFIYKDYGKMGLTLLSRNTGQGVRVCLKPGAFSPDETHFALLQKVMSGEADEAERQAFQERHYQRSCDVLEMDAEDLFTLTPVEGDLPGKARIEPSQPCDECGEPTMPSKMETSGDRQLCRGCVQGS